MKKSTLLRLFRSLTKRDIRELRKFVRSPYFNQRGDVARLFEYLAEAIYREEEALDKDRAFAAVWPGQPYDDDLLRLVMHFLQKHIKRYLAWSELEEAEGPFVQLHLCQALRRRGLDKLYRRELNALKKSHEQHPYRSVGHHYLNYRLHLERHEYDLRQRRSGGENLQELTSELTAFYVSELLRYSCTTLIAQKLSRQKYDPEMVEGVMRLVEGSPVAEAPAVRVYYQAYRALSVPEEESRFARLKELMEQHWAAFPPDEAHDIYLLAINYCIRRLNQGERQYIREAFELYRKGLERRLLFREGELSKFTYNNVLMLAIALEEWEWSAAFLENYKTHLPARERGNIYRYNQAILFFKKGDYGAAMELLQRVAFQDVLYNLNARCMLLRMYYELGEFDALASLLDSFAAYLRRQKALGYHREHYSNLIHYARRLLGMAPHDREERRQLAREVAGEKAVAEREWLLEQLNTG
ncbi:MAG: hypothetical protein KDD10_24530 [Phaeodactylibacter sp.]|nr:hypothetical protein [Phaeodactylibacter sp.]MCB9295021.1 hypothetical protein [Lewinellaceae bacterium]